MNANNIQEIKLRYTMRELLSRFGIEPDKKSFIECPFHKEKTASCKIYEHSFYCFGCGAGGDEIDFVKRYLNKSFAEAIEYLCGEKMSFSEHRKIYNRRRQYEQQKKAENERQEQYNALMDEYVRLDKQRAEYDPKSSNEPLNPLFVEAMKNIERIEFELDSLN